MVLTLNTENPLNSPLCMSQGIASSPTPKVMSLSGDIAFVEFWSWKNIIIFFYWKSECIVYKLGINSMRQNFLWSMSKPLCGRKSWIESNIKIIITYRSFQLKFKYFWMVSMVRVEWTIQYVPTAVYIISAFISFPSNTYIITYCNIIFHSTK